MEQKFIRKKNEDPQSKVFQNFAKNIENKNSNTFLKKTYEKKH